MNLTSGDIQIGDDTHIINNETMTLDGYTDFKKDFGSNPYINSLTNNGTLNFTPVGTVQFGPLTSFTNDGFTSVLNHLTNEGAVTVNAGSTLSVGYGGSYTHNGTSFMVSGTLNNSGAVTVGAGKTLAITSGGTITHSGAAGLTVNGTLTNEGAVSVYSFSPLTIGSGGTFIHNGTSATVSGFLNNSGTVTIAAGKTLALNGLGTFNNNNTLNGGGTIGGTSSSFTNPGAGKIAPGSSPGCLAIAKNFNNNGTLLIELGDGAPCVNYDHLQVTGNATINGNIIISFAGGIAPTTTSFTILDATGILAGSPNITWPAGYSGTYSMAGNELQVSLISLPVALTEFRGNTLPDQTVSLSWRTESETNNAGFDILRSADGRQWESIGFVAGHGTSLGEQSYAYFDEHPMPGLNYYRLKQMDFDGTFEYSKTIGVEVMRIGSGIRIFPNPAKDAATFILESDYSGEAILSLYDLTGRLVKTKTILSNDDVFGTDIVLDGLRSGGYLASVQAGQEQWQELLLVE